MVDTKKKTIVVYSPNWHKGVVGIAASRLVENYYKPTIVLAEKEGELTGSARSVKGFNVKSIFFRFCSENFSSRSSNFLNISSVF